MSYVHLGASFFFDKMPGKHTYPTGGGGSKNRIGSIQSMGNTNAIWNLFNVSRDGNATHQVLRAQHNTRDGIMEDLETQRVMECYAKR